MRMHGGGGSQNLRGATWGWEVTKRILANVPGWAPTCITVA